MSMKHEIKLSLARFQTFVQTVFIVFWLELQCNWQNKILDYRKKENSSNYLGSKCDKSVQQIKESVKQKGKLTRQQNMLNLHVVGQKN